MKIELSEEIIKVFAVCYPYTVHHLTRIYERLGYSFDKLRACLDLAEIEKRGLFLIIKDYENGKIKL